MIRKLFMGGLLAATLAGAVPTYAQQGEHIITMEQADIRAFINDVSMVTGRTFIVDPRVQGKVTISSEQSLNPNEVFDVFKNVMRVHGYTVTRTGGGQYRISLIQGAAQDAPLVDRFGLESQFSTTVVKLQHADASDAAKLIKPLMHSQGILTANPGGKVLVITDYPENLRKARDIVAAMDASNSSLETITLSNMSALDAEGVLNQLGSTQGVRASLKVVALPGSNSVILDGDPAEIARIRPMLLQMDRADNTKKGTVTVVPLRFADGEGIAAILGALLPAYQKDGEPAPTVAYEPDSNTIIISASPDTQSAMEGIIRQLDVRRPQVLVEAIIVEISDTAAKELGVQFAISGLDGSAIPFIGTNFSQSATSVLGLAGAVAGNDFGLPEASQTNLQTAAVNSLLGIEGVAIGGAGRDGNTLFAGIVNALETDENSNILSTPFVTTIDNEPATFLVGQEIPITTGESLGSDLTNPFRTFDREEVGIKLEVLPQISEGDVIRLDIKQEVSSIAGALSTLSSDFVLNKREIETVVLADDKEIIVLGGLIQDDEQITVDKVPVLGDVPVIGNLFRNKGDSRVRTNLMVFMRPTIIRSAADARTVTNDRLNYIRQEDLNFTGRNISKIDPFVNDFSGGNYQGGNYQGGN